MADVQSVLDAVIPSLSKKYGKGIVVKLSSGALVGIPVLLTGIPQFDKALGVGGLPKGRIIEVFGPESSGKTTLCLKVLAQAQAEGGSGAIVDVEHAIDPAWAEKTGVNVDDLILSQPDCAEDALDIVKELIIAETNVVIVDSVSALIPRAELEGNFGDSHMGLQARLMSQAMRKLTGVVKKSGSILIFTNQIRSKIGVIFGSNEVTSGGNALKFYSSVRIDVRKIGVVKNKDSDEPVSNKVKLKIVKNKVAPPFKICEVPLNYETGFDTEQSLFYALVSSGTIKKKGSWFSYNGLQLGQGLEQAKVGFLEAIDDDEFNRLYFEYLEDDKKDEIADDEKIELKKLKRKKKRSKKNAKS